jgi:hypothetical protein
MDLLKCGGITGVLHREKCRIRFKGHLTAGTK